MRLLFPVEHEERRKGDDKDNDCYEHGIANTMGIFLHRITFERRYLRPSIFFRFSILSLPAACFFYRRRFCCSQRFRWADLFTKFIHDIISIKLEISRIIADKPLGIRIAGQRLVLALFDCVYI